jgi:hypothetical protein
MFGAPHERGSGFEAEKAVALGSPGFFYGFDGIVD